MKYNLLPYILNTENLNDASLKVLNEIVEKYPFFQTAHLLQVLNRFENNDYKTEKHLAHDSTIVHIGNRKHMYDHIMKVLPPNYYVRKTQQQDFSKKTKVKRHDAYEEMMSPAMSEQIVINSLLSLPEAPVQQNLGDDDKKRKQNLIDKFIHDAPTIERPKATEHAPIHQNEDENNDSQEIFTETLARIYLKQGHLQKAKQIYEKLSLKFPEKITYFAVQLEQIKHLSESSKTNSNKS